jgi:hypothetical protein
MLARSGRLPEGEGYGFELNWDGCASDCTVKVDALWLGAPVE